MYDKFFLSDEQLNKIKNFTSDQILLIYGNPGIGKTTLAKEILKDSSITIIDSLFLKKGINIYEYKSSTWPPFCVLIVCPLVGLF